MAPEYAFLDWNAFGGYCQYCFVIRFTWLWCQVLKEPYKPWRWVVISRIIWHSWMQIISSSYRRRMESTDPYGLDSRMSHCFFISKTWLFISLGRNVQGPLRRWFSITTDLIQSSAASGNCFSCWRSQMIKLVPCHWLTTWIIMDAQQNLCMWLQYCVCTAAIISLCWQTLLIALMC